MGIKDEFLRLLREDEEFRLAVAELLGLDAILRELKALRGDFNRFVKMEERWKQNEERWKENEKRWEENEKRWQENFKRWEENERRWQENEKRWQENWRRWEENKRRWEENWKRWEENERKWEENFKRWEEADRKFRWIMNALLDIRDALGGAFEYYTARVVSQILRERGIECDVKVNVTLPIDGFKEVDLICYEPLVVGEVTVRLRSIEEAEGQIEKLLRAVDATERFTGRKTYMKVLAIETAPEDVVKHLRARAEELGIHLILGRGDRDLSITNVHPSQPQLQ